MEKLKTVNIKGKDYTMVHERIKAFRINYDLLTLETEIIELTQDVAVVKAMIKDQEGRLLANAFARELQADRSSMVNKTSHLENCETSAVGRALGFLGIGIDNGIASYEEVQNAIQREKTIDSSKSPSKVSKNTNEGNDSQKGKSLARGANFESSEVKAPMPSDLKSRIMNKDYNEVVKAVFSETGLVREQVNPNRDKIKALPDELKKVLSTRVKELGSEEYAFFVAVLKD